MPRTPEEEAEYQALGQQLGVFPALAPQQPDASLPARFGQDVANIPSDIGQTFVSGARNLLNINQPPELQLAPWNVPRPYDVAPATSLGQRLTDLGPSLAGSLAAAAIPGSAVSKLGVLAGAADFAPIMGDVAGGVLTGASQSADNAVPEGATFGMLGLANRIPNPWLRMAANAAIPVGDQLLHGQSPTDQQSLINTGTGIALAALLGGHAQPQDGAPLLTRSAPDDSAEPPPQQLLLNAPPQPGEVRGGVVYAQPSATDLSPDRSFTTPGYVPPGTGDVAPLPTGLPAPRTLADAAYAGDIVTFNGLLGEVQQGPDGYYVSGDDGTQRLFGKVPDQPLHQIEGLVPEITGDRAPDVEPPFNPNQTVPHTDSILDSSITSASAGTGTNDLDARMAEREQSTDLDDHHQAVSDAVDSVVSQYPDADVQVHQTFDDIPDEDLKARAMAQDPNLVNAEGFNDPATGTQHIISENVADADRAREVAVHEVVGHYGVDQIIDPQDWQGIQDHVLSRGGALADSISQLYHGKDLGDLNDAERNRVTREYVAQVAENTNLDPTLWQKVTAAVRKALRAAGINRDWSDAEIQDLVRKAHKSLKEGSTSDLIAGTIDAARSKGTPSTIPQEPLRTPADDQQEQAVKQAYGRLAERTGFPSVAISDLATESRQPLEAVKSLLTRSHQEGKALLSQGDWSTASPEKRLGSIEANNGYGGPAKNLLVRMLSDAIEPSAAKPLLQHVTDTAPFKRWFGDSKVVDSSGEPVVAWHGRKSAPDSRNLLPEGPASRAVWFSTERDIAKRYSRGAYDPRPNPSKFLFPAYLKIDRPFEFDNSDQVMSHLSEHLPEEYDEQNFDNSEDGGNSNALDRSDVRDALKRLGYDGAHYTGDSYDGEGGDHESWIAFDPEQIKSARGNSGQFDFTNPNVDASLPRRLDDAARGQQEDQPSLLGKAARFLETDLGMSKTDQTKLAEEKGIGVQSSLIGKVNDAADAYRKDKPLLTPAQDTAARLFQQTDTTPASVAALKAASLPKTAEDLLVAAADVKTNGQATIAAAETPEHAAVINKSEGYQRRAYQIFTDPKTWIKRLGRGDYSKQIDDAAAWAKSRPEFAGADPATIRRAVSMFASDIANGRDFTMGGDSQKISQSLYLTKKDLTPQQWRTMETLRGDSRLSPSEQDTVKGIVRDQHLKPSDQKFMDVLSRRGGFSPDEAATLKAIGQQETVAPQIRALFGEHTDPIEQAMYTAQKITGSVRQAETIKQIAESSYPDGRKLAYKDSGEYQQALNGATGDAKRALLRYKQLPKSDGFGVLAGRWADVGVGDTINAMNQGAADGGNAFLAKLQKVMKLNATVLNPATHFHWWMQMPLMMSMARVYNPAQWLEAGKIVLGSDASRNAVRDELIRNGILDGGASNEFTGNARSISNIREPETTLGKIKMGGDKAIQYLGQLYGHPDEIIRSAAYLSAKAKALASGLSEQKAQDAAITFTNKYTFNYKAVPRAVANASNIPGLNPFLRYSSELTRITKNLAQDVISGTGEDRTHGALNLALMAAVPLAASLGSSSTNLSPEDQADWDRLRKLEPPDMRGQIKFVLGRKKDGTFNYFDISPLLPAGDTFNVAKDVLKGDWKAFAEDQPLVGLSHSPIASLGIDLSTGTNSSTGQKMFTAGDYASRIAQPLLPPVLGSQLQHDIRSFSTNAQGGTGLTNPRTGREDTPVTSLLGHVGLRLNSENTGVLMRSALSDANDEKAAAAQILRQTAATNAAPAAQQKALLQYQGRLADINKSLLARIQP